MAISTERWNLRQSIMAFFISHNHKMFRRVILWLAEAVVSNVTAFGAR